MGSRNVRSMVTGFTAVAFALVTGCTAEGNPPKEVVSEAEQASVLAPASPICTNANTKWAVAIPHTSASTETGFTRRMPNPTGNQTVDSYESSVWNIPHANGYAYLVNNTFWNDGCTSYTTACFPAPGTALIYLTGIADANASPSYSMTPPSPGNVRAPWTIGLTMSATPYDYNTEVALSTNPNTAAPGHAPLNSSHVNCVGVEDSQGNVLDYFVLADLHDPHGPNW